MNDDYLATHIAEWDEQGRHLVVRNGPRARARGDDRRRCGAGPRHAWTTAAPTR
jgi:hypothetical protein